MKNQNGAQVNDLCEKLNMDFDEANELFGSETLDGMKMARICGAGDYWGNYNTVISCAGYEAYAFCLSVGGYGTAGEYSDLLIRADSRFWMLNGTLVKDVEVSNGSFTYSFLGPSEPYFDPTGYCTFWETAVDAIRNCLC